MTDYFAVFARFYVAVLLLCAVMVIVTGVVVWLSRRRKLTRPDRAISIAREVFPGFTDEKLCSIMWNQTSYPIFWHGDPATELRAQLEDYKVNGPLVDLEKEKRLRG